MNKFIGVIPARSGSKGVKNKNIRELGGIPLILWTVIQALKSNLDQVIVDSDSDDYLELVRTLPGVDVNLRPAHLATDDTLTIDVLQNLFIDCSLNTNDFVLLLQPTCPFRTSKMINQSIELLKQHPTSSVVSLDVVDNYHPLRMKRVINGRVVNYLDTGYEDMRPRQELPKVFIRSGSIYGSKIFNIKTQNSILNDDQKPIFELADLSVNIDTMIDFALAEQLLESQPELGKLRSSCVNYINANTIS